MIASLRGNLAQKQLGSVVIDVNGVGYEVHVSSQTFDRLPPVGEEASLVIHTAVREDAITLFGFSAAEEKELFLLLTSVTGIGPKLALAILSGLAADALVAAISSKDAARLTSISGVGKKTAQRLCMELQEKVGHLGVDMVAESGGATSVAPTAAMQEQADAVSALINLGYPQQLANQAIRKVFALHPEKSDDWRVEDLIREALRILA